MVGQKNMSKNVKIKIVGNIMADKKLGDKIVWTDEMFKAYYGVSKRELETALNNEIMGELDKSEKELLVSKKTCIDISK
jgi:hypothetical protein